MFFEEMPGISAGPFVHLHQVNDSTAAKRLSGFDRVWVAPPPPAHESHRLIKDIRRGKEGTMPLMTCKASSPRL